MQTIKKIACYNELPRHKARHISHFSNTHFIAGVKARDNLPVVPILDNRPVPPLRILLGHQLQHMPRMGSSLTLYTSSRSFQPVDAPISDSTSTLYADQISPWKSENLRLRRPSNHNPSQWPECMPMLTESRANSRQANLSRIHSCTKLH